MTQHPKDPREPDHWMYAQTLEDDVVERAKQLIAQIEAGQFEAVEAAADQWFASAGVQRMANAMASVFERYASQEIMDRFREKLGALMHLAFVEGAAQGVLQASPAIAAPPPRIPEGFALVPEVPTEAMMLAGIGFHPFAARIWSAMIAAGPQAPALPETGVGNG